MANSNSPASKAARIKASKSQKVRRKAEGYQYFSVELRPDSAAAMATIQQETGESKNAVINRALIELAKK